MWRVQSGVCNNLGLQGIKSNKRLCKLGKIKKSKWHESQCELCDAIFQQRDKADTLSANHIEAHKVLLCQDHQEAVPG